MLNLGHCPQVPENMENFCKFCDTFEICILWKSDLIWYITPKEHPKLRCKEACRFRSWILPGQWPMTFFLVRATLCYLMEPVHTLIISISSSSSRNQTSKWSSQLHERILRGTLLWFSRKQNCFGEHLTVTSVNCGTGQPWFHHYLVQVWEIQGLCSKK